MSIGSLINKNTYLGNASTGTYNYNFKIFKSTELKVIVIDLALVETVLSDSTYTVTGVKNKNGGTIALIGPVFYLDAGGFLLSGYKLVIKRQLDLVQETDIRNQGDFFPEVHEDVFDRQTMVDQQLQEQIDRSIKLPESAGNFNTVLPTDLLGAANVTIATDASGTKFVVGPTTDQIAGAAVSAASATASKLASAASATASSNSATGAAGSAVAAAGSAAAAANTLASSSGRIIVFLTTLDSPVSVLQANNGTLYVCDVGAGPIVFNLPTISGLLLPFNISIKLEAGLNQITINRSGTDTIGGLPSKEISSIGAGTFLFADAGMTPDNWTDVNFGVSAGNYTKFQRSGNGVQTTFPLDVVPSAEENLDVFWTGIYQNPNSYTIVGSNIVFDSASPTGLNNMDFKVGRTLDIGVPSDNTLTTDKYINGSITNEKMALGAGWTTGDVKPTFKVVADPSWVLMNDGTIGNLGSGATTRANVDTFNLYSLLWTNVSDVFAPVIGSRGVSALADFNSGKPLTLTKALGMAWGFAGAGVGLTARALGSNVGFETHTLIEDELALHNHSQNPHVHSYAFKNVFSPPNTSASGGSFPEISSNINTSDTIATNNPAGGNVPHNNMQPTMFLNAMIKL